MCSSVWSSSGTRLCTRQPIIISSVWPCPICSTCSWVGLINIQFAWTYLHSSSAYRTTDRGISVLASVSIFVWPAILQAASIRIGSVSRIFTSRIIIFKKMVSYCRCSYVSVFTIVAFSMERFLAICHPLHVYTMSGFERASKIITALWILSFLGAVPFGIKSEIEYLTYPIGK